MKPKQWAIIRELFTEARKLPQESRDAFLQSQCSDQIIINQVKQLLAHDHEDNFLDAPALGDEFSLTDSQRAATGMSIPEKLIVGYSLTKILGSGTSGIVYEARQHEPNRMVAIKVLRDSAMGTDEQSRFRREAETLAELTHPNIATIFATGVTNDGSPWMAMELINGTRLNHWAAHASPHAVAIVMKKIANGVQQAHEKHIIHRDLKPANILVTNEDEPKVLDFGVARINNRGDSSIVTQTGAVIGTRRYMSPEQAAGSSAVDERSDVYALGVILLELLQLSKVKDLHTIATKAIDENPIRRYSNAGELSDDLERWLTSKPIQARPPSLVYTASLWISRHRYITSLTCLVAIAALVTTHQIQKRGWIEYASLIQQAQLAYEKGDLAQMTFSLAKCEESKRKWEWYWLHRISSASKLSMRTMSVASSSNSQVVASLPNGNVIEAIRGTHILKVPFHPAISLVSGNCSTIVAVNQSGLVSIFSTFKPKEVHETIQIDVPVKHVSAIAISFNGDFLVLALTPPFNPKDISTIDANTRIIGFNLRTNSIVLDAQLAGRILDTNDALAVSNSGTTIASLIHGGITVWRFGDTNDCREIKKSNSPSTVAINPDGSLIAIASLGSGTSSVQLLNAQTLQPTENAPIIAHDRGIISVDISPNTSKIASVDGGGVLRITPLQGGPPVIELIHSREQSASVQFSSDSNQVLIREGNGITRMRFASNRVLDKKVWSDNPLVQVYIVQGKIFAQHVNGSSTYNFETGTLTFSQDELEVPSRTSGARIVRVVDGGIIRILDPANETPLLSFSWPGAHIIGAGFVYEGMTVVAVSVDGRIRIWNPYK